MLMRVAASRIYLRVNSLRTSRKFLPGLQEISVQKLRTTRIRKPMETTPSGPAVATPLLQGSIRFQGQDITRVPAPQRAKLGLGRSFQNIALFRGMTVLDNIKLGRHAHLKTNVLDALLYFGRARREEAELRRDIEERIIDFLEIDHIRHAPVSALPYGLQKRVEMARALTMQPQILMLDEPGAGMNREETEDMAFWITDIKNELGITVLMVEHDMTLVSKVSDRVLAMSMGTELASGTPAQVQADPGVIEVNIHPAHTWGELVEHTEFLYEAAHQTKMCAEKFMTDGRHTGTVGGLELD
eukprot:gene18411-37330_t